MPVGPTTTGTLSDSLPFIIDTARTVREYPMVMVKVTMRVKLTSNSGLSYEEIELSQISAQGITESTIFDNPQQFVDTLRTYTPTMTSVNTLLTDRVYRRMPTNVLAQLGSGMMNAIMRKQDEDGIATGQAATTTLAGAGTTLTSGHISAGASRARFGGGTEPSQGPIHAVLQSYQVKDLQDETVSGVGTYVVSAGMTEEVYKKGFVGSVNSAFGANIWVDDNISIDANDDAEGFIFPQEAIILVDGMDIKKNSKYRPEYGGGADQIWLTTEYVFAERGSPGIWLYSVLSDATAPTS